MDKMRASHVVDKGRIVCDQSEVIAPTDGEVMVKINYAAICGSDLHTVYSESPLPPWRDTRGFPGHEGIGTIVESRDPNHKVGDRVLCCPVGSEAKTGTFAEYHTASGSHMIPLPKTDVPEDELLMAQQFGTTIFALRQVAVDVVGKTCVVMGQGSAGLFFANSLKRWGAKKVIASDLSESRLGISKQFGVDLAVKGDPGNLTQTVLEETNGEGCDILVEAVGAQSSLAESVGMIKFRGRGIFFGLPDTNKLVPFNFFDFQRKQLNINAPGGAQHEGDRVSFKEALRLIASRECDVRGLISHRYKIEDIESAFQRAEHRDDNARKVIFEF